MWLVDSAADIHVCNDKSLMTGYYEKPTRIGRSIADGMLPGQGNVRFCLSLKGGKEGVILDLKDVFFLPSSPSNLVSLGLLNNYGIFHNNEDKTLYDKETKTPLAYAQRWKNSFLLQPLNFPDSAVNLMHVNDNTYIGPHVHQTINTKLPLTTWHKRLGHLNFASLKRYLRELDIEYSDNSPGHICNSCQRAKATKIYNRQEPQKRAKTPF